MPEGDGDGATYTVALEAQPRGSVTISIGGLDGADVSVDKKSLVFTRAAWNVAQTVTVTAGEDADAENDELTLVHHASGSYLLGATVELPVTVLDDDEPSTAIKVTADTTSVGEWDGRRTVTVTATLDRAAFMRDIRFRFDVGAGTADLEDFQRVEPFAAWIRAGQKSASASFQLRPVNDNVEEGDETLSVGGSVIVPATGLSLSVEPASVTITDDDTRGVVIGASTLTVEQGEGTSYTIVLTSRPTANVTVAVVLPPDSGLTARPANVVFGAPF